MPLDRRSFIASAAGLGAAAMLARRAVAQGANEPAVFVKAQGAQAQPVAARHVADGPELAGRGFGGMGLNGPRKIVSEH